MSDCVEAELAGHVLCVDPISEIVASICFRELIHFLLRECFFVICLECQLLLFVDFSERFFHVET